MSSLPYFAFGTELIDVDTDVDARRAVLADHMWMWADHGRAVAVPVAGRVRADHRTGHQLYDEDGVGSLAAVASTMMMKITYSTTRPTKMPSAILPSVLTRSDAYCAP